MFKKIKNIGKKDKLDGLDDSDQGREEPRKK